MSVNVWDVWVTDEDGARLIDTVEANSTFPWLYEDYIAAHHWAPERLIRHRHSTESEGLHAVLVLWEDEDNMTGATQVASIRREAYCSPHVLPLGD